MPKKAKLDAAGLLKELDKESDRAAAVLGPALLDHLLGELFRTKMHPDTKSDTFEFRGPLGDFAGRIELAFALGWIDAETRDDITTIRKIRNDFAHDVDHTLRFADPTYRDRLRQMHVSKRVRARIVSLGQKYPLPPEAGDAMNATLANFDNPRSQFNFAIVVLAGPITECIQDGPIAPTATKSVSAFVDPILDSALKPLEEGLREITKPPRTT